MRFGALAFVAILANPSYGTERIVIEGERPLNSDNSQVLTIEPENQFEEDLTYWIKRHSNLRLIQSSLPSSTGFGIPSVRGRNPKYTEVYLGHWLFQDPLTGYPLIDEIDLRFFNRLELQIGNGSIRNPSLSPYATIRYQMTSSNKRQARVGLDSGDVYGESLWSLLENPSNHGTSFQKYYFRLHRSAGKYPVFDNRGTPLNTWDDSQSEQINNDQTSRQAIIYSLWDNDDHSLAVLARIFRKQYGIAPINPTFESLARSDNRSGMALVDYGYFGVLNTPIHFTAGYRDDFQQTKDPKRQVLGTLNHLQRSNLTQEFGVNISHNDNNLFALFFQSEWKNTKIESRGDDSYDNRSQRTLNRTYIGSEILASKYFTISSKADWISARSQDSQDKKQSDSHSRGLSINGQIGNNWATYNLQWSETKLLPNLLAEFGNGSGIQPNLEIAPELTKHWEVGLQFAPLWQNQVRLGYFSDQIKDKVIFIPVSLGQEKAVNVDQSEIKGFEIFWEAYFQEFSGSLSATLLEAVYRNDFGQSVLPRIPKNSLTMELAYSTGTFHSFLLHRYDGDVYLDLNNDQKIPGFWITDLGLGFELKFWSSQWRISGLLANALNTTKIDYSTAYGDGAIPYSQWNGFPLPGRNYKLQLELTF